jgi:transcriptional regulator ATRX
LVQWFDVNVLSPLLPPKLEYVLSVRLSELQALLYEHFLQYNAKAGPNRDSPGRLFAHYYELAHLWTHPKALLLGGGKGKEENLPGSSGDRRSGEILQK